MSKEEQEIIETFSKEALNELLESRLVGGVFNVNDNCVFAHLGYDFTINPKEEFERWELIEIYRDEHRPYEPSVIYIGLKYIGETKEQI